MLLNKLGHYSRNVQTMPGDFCKKALTFFTSNKTLSYTILSLIRAVSTSLLNIYNCKPGKNISIVHDTQLSLKRSFI